MSKENVMKFEERMAQEKKLQEKLEEAAKAYKGDKNDSKAVFEAVIAPVAKEAGLEFTYEEASEAQKNALDEEIDLKEMKAVAGGAFGGFCILIGGGKRAGYCVLLGCTQEGHGTWDGDVLPSSNSVGAGVLNCDGLGFGIGGFGGFGGND